MIVATWLSAGSIRAQHVDHGNWEARRHALADLMVRSGIHDSATLAAIRSVPRHDFVPAHLRQQAYDDAPLPIGHEATISQPYIVALMTELVRPRPGMRALEIGTGSGYQAAILAATGAAVWTIDIVPELADSARARLQRLGYRGIEVRAGDGWLGWPEAAPFDAILVTAAAPEIPRPLIEQLAPLGRLVIPVGERDGIQTLMLVEKNARGEISERRLVPVRFVPLQRRR